MAPSRPSYSQKLFLSGLSGADAGPESRDFSQASPFKTNILKENYTILAFYTHIL
jgi:hypothetical protein